LGWADRVDISKLPQDVRRRILEYAYMKGVRASDLGIDRTYFYKLRAGKYPVTDQVLERALGFISEEEFRRLAASRSLEAYGIERGGVIDYGLVLEIIRRAGEDPYLRSIILRAAKELEERAPEEVIVSEEDLKRFELLLADRAPKTREDRVRYLRKALEELGWVLTPQKLQEYIAAKTLEGGEVATHYAKALKLFIKLVLRNKALYEAFKATSPAHGLRPSEEYLSEGQLASIACRISHEGARAYFILLAETGLRPGEALGLRVSDVDLKARVIRVMRVGRTKRSYITFLHPETARYLSEVYIPYLREAVKRAVKRAGALGIDPSKVLPKLFPFKPATLRAKIYRASEETLGRRVGLYSLRKGFATHMTLKGVPPAVINILQGRAPPREFKLLEERYTVLTLEALRRYYEENAPKVAARLSTCP